MNQNLAIIGASYLQLPLIEKAKQMGYTTHVFAWAANDVGEAAADCFYPVSIVEKEEILEICGRIGICGICSIASDLAMLTVNYVAEKLGLTGNSMEATIKSTNKHEMRLAFEAAGDPSPRSIQVDETTDLRTLKLEYPVIVKPTDRSGSRGINKVERYEDLPGAVADAMTQSFEKTVLIEEYAHGQEYSVEFISCRGVHHFLALTHKYTTGAPHFIETGHLQPAPVDRETLEKVKKVTVHALNTLGITNGASHTELKIASDGTIRIIEIGGRMGGDCIGSDMVLYSTGKDFVKMVIQVAVGQEPDLSVVYEPHGVEVRFIFTREDLDAFYALRDNEPERLLKVVDLKPENLGLATDSSSRAGCYLVRA